MGYGFAWGYPPENALQHHTSEPQNDAIRPSDPDSRYIPTIRDKQKKGKSSIFR